MYSVIESFGFSKSNIETLEKCYLMWFLDCDNRLIQSCLGSTDVQSWMSEGARETCVHALSWDVGHASLLTNLVSWCSRMVRNIGYLRIFSPIKCSNMYSDNAMPHGV